MSEKNKALARRYPMEAFETRNVNVVDDLLTADFRDHDPGTPQDIPPGPEGIKPVLEGYLAAMGDINFTIEDQIAEGDKVLTRWTVRMTHSGELMGVPATGKSVSFSGITLLRLENGKIAEEWSNWDGIGLLEQIGALPSE